MRVQCRDRTTVQPGPRAPSWRLSEANTAYTNNLRGLASSSIGRASRRRSFVVSTDGRGFIMLACTPQSRARSIMRAHDPVGSTDRSSSPARRALCMCTQPAVCAPGRGKSARSFLKKGRARYPRRPAVRRGLNGRTHARTEPHRTPGPSMYTGTALSTLPCSPPSRGSGLPGRLLS